ncbi:MAG: nucleoside phosphorylase [Dokdonia sp.]|jgi:uridine phosphorylase
MSIQDSELILNPDGSIYHLHLKPQDIATTIITVGDPARVDAVAAYFDEVRFTTQKREFKTTTGFYKGLEITVISTGIGTDNIDIVLNELDALVNVDLKTRTVLPTHTALDIVRIGTSGAIQTDIAVDTFVLSQMAIGLDALLHFYQSEHIQHKTLQQDFVSHMDWAMVKSEPYIVGCDYAFAKAFTDPKMILGCTATNIGFYGPQGRQLRLQVSDQNMNDKLQDFKLKLASDTSSSDKSTLRITNLEMETAGIYGLAKLLGHRAVSLNVILANRVHKTFSSDPKAAIDQLIGFALDRLVTHSEQ